MNNLEQKRSEEAKKRSKVTVHIDKAYFCNLGVNSRGSGSKGRLNLYCTKFINNTLSSSLPIDVSQVWPNHVKLFAFLLVSFNIHLVCSR